MHQDSESSAEVVIAPSPVAFRALSPLFAGIVPPIATSIQTKAEEIISY